MKKLSAYTDHAYSSLRIVAGFMFLFHGAQKILGLFMTHPMPELGSQIWIGGLIELVGGLLIMIGLFTRWAAFLASGTMAVAYIQFHWKFQLGSMILPLINQGEMAVLYCFVFLLIACNGAGKWGLEKAD
ncbi:MAG: DoxX family protein [Elusimicrobia bacterium RIFCSPLOWO2_01_FULL_54_10]|nr:MAG: DoxX family protein [Elusimicrobia bacterium RIFCSPLOWO2_01_FULL_54_10]